MEVELPFVLQLKGPAAGLVPTNIYNNLINFDGCYLVLWYGGPTTNKW